MGRRNVKQQNRRRSVVAASKKKEEEEKEEEVPAAAASEADPDTEAEAEDLIGGRDPTEWSIPGSMMFWMTPEMYITSIVVVEQHLEDRIFGSFLMRLDIPPSKVDVMSQVVLEHARRSKAASLGLSPDDPRSNFLFVMGEPVLNVLVGRSYYPNFFEALLESHKWCHGIKITNVELTIICVPTAEDQLSSTLVHICKWCKKQFRVDSHNPRERRLLEQGLARKRALLGEEELRRFLAIRGVRYCNNLP